MRYSKQEMIRMILNLKNVFDIVRLVDTSRTKQYDIIDYMDFVERRYECYAVWGKRHRCDNCISAKALQNKCRMSKYEFVNNDVYYVVAKYIEMDQKPFVLEIVSKVTDEILFGAYGKGDFIENIKQYNKELYIDALTGAYNRKYYEEQLQNLVGKVAFVMVDIDDFKGINDTYGHDAGDEVLKGIVDIIRNNIKASDSIVRFGGDEFVIIMPNIDEDVVGERMCFITNEIANASLLKGHPDTKVTISVGIKQTDNINHEINVMRKADKALYEAKKTKNCQVFVR